MYLKKSKPSNAFLSNKTTPTFRYSGYFNEKNAPEKKPLQLVYQNIHLQHLNPGYENKEAAEFLKYYKSKEPLVLETFKYNNETNEENFVIEIATLIRIGWIHGGSTPASLFRQFNRSRNELLSM